MDWWEVGSLWEIPLGQGGRESPWISSLKLLCPWWAWILGGRGTVARTGVIPLDLG